MATTLKILGQLSPASTTPSDLYTVPSSTSTVCSTLVVCNRNTVDTTFRVAVRKNGNSLSSEHYLYYDVILAANDTFAATIGISLSSGDVVTVYSGNGLISFNLFGQENS